LWSKAANDFSQQAVSSIPADTWRITREAFLRLHRVERERL
jgi:hypothetical protein